jgi:hypothetical protein
MKSLGYHIPPLITQKLAQLQVLNQALYEIIPIEFLGHVHTAGLENGILHICVDSPVWATRLRFQQQAITRQLSDKIKLTIKSLRILVKPAAVSIPSSYTRKPYFSRSSADLLKGLGNNTQDPQLREALLKLAKRRF